MKHADERVALQAVEFWTTVCEEEVELAAEANEVCAVCQVHRITSEICPIRLPSSVKYQKLNPSFSQRSRFRKSCQSCSYYLPVKRKTQMRTSGPCRCLRVLVSIISRKPLRTLSFPPSFPSLKLTSKHKIGINARQQS